MNYQTKDKPNQFNRALFRNNGNCGYVLKPEFLRDASISYSPLSPSGLPHKRFPPWTLTVQVLSGQHLPKPDGAEEGEVIDPYVKVRVRGHPDDTHSKNKGKTEHVSNNGFNPVWRETGPFTFDIRVPQLAFLEFKVKDHSKSGTDKEIGSYTCNVPLLQEGTCTYIRQQIKPGTRTCIFPNTCRLPSHLP